MASTYLVRSTPSETFNKLTVSCWFKGMADGTQRNFWGLYDNSDSNRFFALYYSTNGSLYGYWKQNEGTFFTLGTSQKFRDPNAWYHFVMTMDTTLSTASDRVKFYVNGERITSFEDTLDTITQNQTCNLMNGTTDGRMQWGGGKVSGTQYYWNGLMSHCHMCVGYAYDASSFGSTDATTGEWKINTSPSVSYGTNGGFWLKDGSQLTDSSSNSNTLTVGGGTLTKTLDCPSNVFATLNPLVNYNNFSGGTLSNGNTTHSNSSGTSNKISTLGMTSGKFYAEAKYTGGGNYNGVGFCSEPFLSGAASLANSTHGASLTYTDVYNGGVAYGTYATPSTNDIIGIALDIDNGYAYFSNNGVWGNSGVPTSGSTGTGGFLISKTDANSTYFFASEQNATPGTRGAEWNFGNGFFGTTAVATNSGNGYAGAEGSSIFNYQPPTGYSALSTKGLNQ